MAGAHRLHGEGYLEANGFSRISPTQHIQRNNTNNTSGNNFRNISVNTSSRRVGAAREQCLRCGQEHVVVGTLACQNCITTYYCSQYFALDIHSGTYLSTEKPTQELNYSSFEEEIPDGAQSQATAKGRESQYI